MTRVTTLMVDPVAALIAAGVDALEFGAVVPELAMTDAELRLAVVCLQGQVTQLTERLNLLETGPHGDERPRRRE